MRHQLKRKYNVRSQYKVIYIFSEGEETEPNYFESKREEIGQEIRRNNIKIEITGTGRNTISLVDYVIDYLDRERIKINDSPESDECWVVFDKDDHEQTFNNAISKANQNNIRVAYSIESFELWYFLHFNFCDSALSRTAYKEKLDEIIKNINGQKYKKNSKEMYSLIRDKENDAIRNAVKLMKIHEQETSHYRKNPSTTVHLLVERLNKLKIE